MVDQRRTNHTFRGGWYPPAEVKVPVPALLSALLPGEANFQAEICRYLGVDYCLCAGSARLLLSLVLETLWKRAGKQRNEVLLPGYTCYSVAASVVRAGLKIQVYDLDPRTFQPDLDSVKQGMNERTLAVVTQHLFGIPSPVKSIKDLAGELGAYLIEDAAQSLGATIAGHQVGTLGDFGFYSFGRGKPLPLGCGGVIVGKVPSILQEIDLPKEGGGYGQLLTTAVVQLLSHRRLYGFMEALPLGLGETIFNPGFPISSMPLKMQRLGKYTVDFLKILNAHRRTIAGIYDEKFGNIGVIPVEEGSYPIYSRFPIMADSTTISNELKKLGVRRMYPRALRDEPGITKFLANQRMKTLGASMIAERLITLPTHMGIEPDDASAIAAEIKRAYKVSIQ
jgi:perosamine synthetase